MPWVADVWWEPGRKVVASTTIFTLGDMHIPAVQFSLGVTPISDTNENPVKHPIKDQVERTILKTYRTRICCLSSKHEHKICVCQVKYECELESSKGEGESPWREQDNGITSDHGLCKGRGTLSPSEMWCPDGQEQKAALLSRHRMHRALQEATDLALGEEAAQSKREHPCGINERDCEKALRKGKGTELEEFQARAETQHYEVPNALGYRLTVGRSSVPTRNHLCLSKHLLWLSSLSLLQDPGRSGLE